MITSIIMDVMLIIVSMVITLIAAALTVPAGFGLATMLTPVVLLWLPPHEAIAVVAIIHGAHNAWKLKVLRSSINIDAVKRYGWALILGAIIGSLLQSRIPSNPLLLVVGIALIILPLLSVTEKWTKLRLGETEDRIGGFGSGFWGPGTFAIGPQPNVAPGRSMFSPFRWIRTYFGPLFYNIMFRILGKLVCPAYHLGQG